MNHDGSLNAVKLELLRKPKHGSPWQTLDEWRCCSGCKKMITAHQMRLDRDRLGLARLCCPTPGCRTTWAEWAAPEQPPSSDTDWHAWVRLLDLLGDMGKSRRPGLPLRRRG